jgi:very-short-patch-repair endonuclease
VILAGVPDERSALPPAERSALSPAERSALPPAAREELHVAQFVAGVDEERSALPPAAREELHVAQFVAGRHRLIRAAELRALGISRSTVSRWTARGRLQREHHGVYSYGGGQLSQDGRLYAALLAIGDDAALGRIAAALLGGFWPHGPPPTIDVIVPRHVRSRRGIRVHSVTELPSSSVMVVRGIPVTTPARTIVDLAGDLRSDWIFRRVVHEAQVQEKVTIAELWDELEGAPANLHGRARLMTEIADGARPTRSGFEDWLVEVLRAGDYPPFETNAHPPGTPAWVEVDVLFREQKLVIEVDGGRWHNTPWRRALDARKQAILEAGGYRVIRLTEDDEANQAQTEARIRRELAERAT